MREKHDFLEICCFLEICGYLNGMNGAKRRKYPVSSIFLLDVRGKCADGFKLVGRQQQLK